MSLILAFLIAVYTYYFPQDDTASLRRLHTIIHGDAEPEEPALQHFTRQDSDEEPSTPKAERRRSLPSRTSMTSISSAYSIAPPSAEETLFQARRKRAAKLTQFFGVNYRDLMNEILDSLEKGLEEERGRGTLRPDEVQVRLFRSRVVRTPSNGYNTCYRNCCKNCASLRLSETARLRSRLHDTLRFPSNAFVGTLAVYTPSVWA